jgi:hypothetical protein
VLLLLSACAPGPTGTDDPADSAPDADADTDTDADADTDADGDADTDTDADTDPFVGEELIDGGGPDYSAGWAIGPAMTFCRDWSADVGVYHVSSSGMGTDGLVDPAGAGDRKWQVIGVAPSHTDFVCSATYGFASGEVFTDEVILETGRYVPGWTVDYTEAILSLMLNSSDIPSLLGLPDGERFTFEIRTAGSTRTWMGPQYGLQVPDGLPAAYPIAIVEAEIEEVDYLMAIDGITGEIHHRVEY